MKRSSPSKRAPRQGTPRRARPADPGIVIDRYRAIVFPNNVRERRKRAGYPTLLGLTALLPHIPYVRLSKIERGEVVAKASEIIAIANALNLAPEQLLLDIDAPDFDIAQWAEGLQDWIATDPEEDRFAVLLAAALRAKRDGDKRLSIATIEQNFGIAPVILSRLENAHKTFDRWNDQTVTAICGIFEVYDAAALRDRVAELYAAGALAQHLDLVANPSLRIIRTRARVAGLRDELTGDGSPDPDSHARGKASQPVRETTISAGLPMEAEAEIAPVVAAIHAADMATIRLVPIFGTPLADGLIARTPTGDVAEAPRNAGPNSYGLRACRATLGPGLPARATVIVDPDRFPSSGGLAVVREAEGLRLLMVTFNRSGGMIGYSENPDREVPLDAIDPAMVASVIAAIYE